MANTLYIRQNDHVVLKCLVAQRTLYTRAKCWAYVPMTAGILLTFIALCGTTGYTSAGKAWLSAIITLILWLLAVVGEEYVGNLKSRAARIQQYIDREIFKEAFAPQELASWRDVPLDGEIAVAMQRVNDGTIDKQHVRNWYANYSALSPQEAVFRSQKENIRWDWGLRVTMALLMALGLMAFAIVVLTKIWDQKVYNALPTLIASAGVASVSSKLLFRLVLDLYRLYRLDAIVSVIEEKLGGNNGVGTELLRIQSLIYDNRRQVVLVPDWLYKIIRHSRQQSEDAIAKAHEELAIRGDV